MGLKNQRYTSDMSDGKVPPLLAAADVEEPTDEATPRMLRRSSSSRMASLSSKMLLAAKSPSQEMSTESSDRIRGYLTFVPCMLARQLVAQQARRAFKYDLGGVDPEALHVHGAVFFADLSGFTKLTERLAVHSHGAELLCTELDRLYTLILEEANEWGGDCVKFAGDAILFCFVANDTSDALDDEVTLARKQRENLALAVSRAVQCSERVHKRIAGHPEVAGVKLTLHAGLGCGPLTASILGGATTPRRFEFVIAGSPLAQIAIAEPLAKPGETVLSPEAASLVDDHVVAVKLDLDGPSGAASDENPSAAYFQLGGLKPDAMPGVGFCAPKPTSGLMETTLPLLTSRHLGMLIGFIPPVVAQALDDRRSAAQLLGKILTPRLPRSPRLSRSISSEVDGTVGGSKSGEEGAEGSGRKAEMRELTTLFVSITGVDLSANFEHSQRVFSMVQRAIYTMDGVINKLLVDDKGTLVVAVFGLPPSVHADTPSRAVASAFLVLDNLGALTSESSGSSPRSHSLPANVVSARIGITTARTYCGVVGAPTRREFTVMGDSVNLSARLMAACFTTSIGQQERPPGHQSVATTLDPEGFLRPLVLMDQDTAQAVEKHAVTVALQPVMVKGKTNAIHIFLPWRFRSSLDDDAVSDHEWEYLAFHTRLSTPLPQIPGKDHLPVTTSDAEASFIGEGPRQNRGKLGVILAKLSQGDAAVAMITGGEGVGKRAVSWWLPFLSPAHGLAVCGSTPRTKRQNLYEDGKISEAALFIAFRGPILSMLHKLVSAKLVPGFGGGPAGGFTYLRRVQKQRNVTEEGMLADSVDLEALASALVPSDLHDDLPLLQLMYPERYRTGGGAQVNNVNQNRLARVLVALVTAAAAMASSAKSPFALLIVLEGIDTMMDHSSWALVGAIHSISSGRRKVIAWSGETDQSLAGEGPSLGGSYDFGPPTARRAPKSPNIEAIVTEFASPGGKPSLMLVGRVLHGLLATAEYLECAGKAASSNTILDVNLLMGKDGLDFLLHQMILRIKALALQATSGEEHQGITAISMASDHPSEGVSTLNAIAGAIDLDIEVKVRCAPDLEKFMLEWGTGRSVFIKELIDDLFTSHFLAINLIEQSGEDSPGGPTKSNQVVQVDVSVRQDKVLEELKISHGLRLKGLARFVHGLSDFEHQADWKLLGQLTSAFSGPFSAVMLHQMLAKSPGWGTGEHLTVEYITKMLRAFVNARNACYVSVTNPPSWMRNSSVRLFIRLRLLELKACILAISLQ